jgi:hypothetical protein
MTRITENIAIFSSLTQTAKLQNCSALDLFQNLITGTAAQAQVALFSNSS